MRLFTKAEGLATLVLLFYAVPQAHAIPILRLTADTGETVTVVDGGAGDLSGASGSVVFLGSLGSWSLNVTTGLSKPLIGSADEPMLDLNSVNATSGGAGTLTIELTDTGFLTSDAMIGTHIGGGTGGTVSMRSFQDLGNQAFGQSVSLADLGLFSGLSFSGSAVSELTGGTPYSLTTVVTISHSGPTSMASSFNATIKVPEPTTLALLGIGLTCIGLSRRRKKV